MNTYALSFIQRAFSRTTALNFPAIFDTSRFFVEDGGARFKFSHGLKENSHIEDVLETTTRVVTSSLYSEKTAKNPCIETS